VSRIVEILALAVFSKMVVVFCPPACHNGRRSPDKIELPAVFRAARPSLLRRLAAGSVKPCAQHGVHPTGGSRRVFKHFAWLEAGSGKMA